MNRERREIGTGEGAFDGQTDGQDSHECLVGHRVDDGSDDGLQFPSSSNVAVDEVGDGRVGEETDGPGVLVVQDEVADDGGGDETGEGEDVRDGVDVFVGGQGREETVFDLEFPRRSGGVRFDGRAWSLD